jgi:curli biogenesis system outer membrane secretion channel CsgG
MKTHFYGKILSFLIIGLGCLIAVMPGFSQTEAGRGKPTIAVPEFAVTGNVSYGTGRNISNSLVNALVKSNRFTVVDRSTGAKAIEIEQIEALKGSIDSATAANIGKRIGAQFLVLGDVIEFSEVPGFGAFGVVNYEATVMFNLKVVNSTTGEIILSESFEKKGSAIGGAKKGTLTGNFKSKAMQDTLGKSIQDVLAELIERIGSSTPSTVSVSQSTGNSIVDCSRINGAKAPRIMVVIPEVHITQKIPDPAGETEIIKKLVEKGFFVVDQKQIAAIRDREKILTALKNPQAAASLGAEFGANIIIIGEAFSELAGREEKLISTRARVEARAIQTDNARILATDGKFGSGLDIAEFVSAKTALRNAGSQWADYFIAQICQVSNTNLTGSNSSGGSTTSVLSSPIEIMVSGISYIQLKRFTDKLATIPGVQNVEKKLTGNVARIDVQFDGDAEKLADVISETSFGTLRLNIVGLSGNKIEIGIGK